MFLSFYIILQNFEMQLDSQEQRLFPFQDQINKIESDSRKKGRFSMWLLTYPSPPKKKGKKDCEGNIKSKS